jgi:hypothetical protein
MNEQAGGRHQAPAPGLVVIIGHRDGRAERVIAPPLIDVTPVERPAD